jgi:hypothetical protein
MRRGFLAAAGLAAAGLFAGSTAGGVDCPAIDPAPPAARPCPAVDTVARAGPAGLRVFLDRRTGRIRPPTPEEARALFEGGGTGAAHLVPIEVVTHPDGMRSVDLKGAFSHRLTLRRNPDGSVSAVCRPNGLVPEEE